MFSLLCLSAKALATLLCIVSKLIDTELFPGDGTAEACGLSSLRGEAVECKPVALDDGDTPVGGVISITRQNKGERDSERERDKSKRRDKYLFKTCCVSFHARIHLVISKN